jgi:hypothetical protein
MTNVLRGHSVDSSYEENTHSEEMQEGDSSFDKETDPRWDELKKMVDNN